MINKNKSKNKKYFQFIENFKETYKSKINNFLDITIIEDNKIKTFKSKIIKTKNKFKKIFNTKIIDLSKNNNLDRYISYFDRKTITAKCKPYFSKIIAKYEKIKNFKFSYAKLNKSQFSNAKSFEFFNKIINFINSKIPLYKKILNSSSYKIFPNFKILKIKDKFK